MPVVRLDTRFFCYCFFVKLYGFVITTLKQILRTLILQISRIRHFSSIHRLKSINKAALSIKKRVENSAHYNSLMIFSLNRINPSVAIQKVGNRERQKERKLEGNFCCIGLVIQQTWLAWCNLILLDKLPIRIRAIRLIVGVKKWPCWCSYYTRLFRLT